MQRSWYNPRHDDWIDFDAIEPCDIWVTDNPVIGELLGPDGTPLVQFQARRPIGYR